MPYTVITVAPRKPSFRLGPTLRKALEAYLRDEQVTQEELAWALSTNLGRNDLGEQIGFLRSERKSGRMPCTNRARGRRS